MGKKYHTVGTFPKYHTVGTVPKSNIKIVEIGKFVTPNTQMHDSLLTWLCMGTWRKWKNQVIDKIHPDKTNWE